MLQDFHEKYPNIAIQHTGGKSDQDIAAGRQLRYGARPRHQRRAGQRREVLFERGVYRPDADLQNDGIDLSKEIPEPATRYTSYEGNQCTLPVLSDAYGLYYNKDMFEAAGISKLAQDVLAARGRREEADDLQP